MNILLAFILVTLFLGIGIFGIYLELFKKTKLTVPEKKFYQDKWQKIRTTVKTSNNEAVLEADKLLNHILKKLGAKGKTVNNRIMCFAKRFKNLDNLKKAHRLRNRIAHELDYKASDKLTSEALTSFEKAFKDLGLFKY